VVDLAIDALGEIVGEDHVITAPDALEALSHDLSREPFEIAQVAVAPGSVDELVAVVKEARKLSLAIVARGAAWSYTRSHTPATAATLLIDMRRLNRVREINADDLFVTVETGCTWENLYLALRQRGVRTPFFGPLSGRYATIGGGLSQNAEFFGSGRYGAASDSVLGLEVILADGTLVRTGSGAHRTGSPFARSFGPDLTGLFIADSGTLGIKASATFTLVPTPALTVGASFAFDELLTLVAAMRDVARTRLAAELYAFGDLYHKLLGRIGFSFLEGIPWTLHITVDGADEAIAESTLALLRRIAGRRGRELPSSVPMAIRADPWGATRAMFQSAGKAVHLPIHALLPFSKAEDAIAIYDRFARERRPIFKQHGIETWVLPAASGKDFLFEATVYFPEDASPEVQAAALELRGEVARLFDPLGAVHMQLGKYYDFAPVLEESTLTLLRGIKQLVDPNSVLNPGALGLS
jgi:FAD/FMN-containing dehydrogenase